MHLQHWHPTSFFYTAVYENKCVELTQAGCSKRTRLQFRFTDKEQCEFGFGHKVHYTALIKDGKTGEHVSTNTGEFDFFHSAETIHTTDFKMEKRKNLPNWVKVKQTFEEKNVSFEQSRFLMLFAKVGDQTNIVFQWWWIFKNCSKSYKQCQYKISR